MRRSALKDKLRLFAQTIPALFTRFIQHFVEVVQLSICFTSGAYCSRRSRIALQHMPDFGVYRRGRAHHRFIEFVAGQPTFCRDGHFIATIHSFRQPAGLANTDR